MYTNCVTTNIEGYTGRSTEAWITIICLSSLGNNLLFKRPKSTGDYATWDPTAKHIVSHDKKTAEKLNRKVNFR